MDEFSGVIESRLESTQVFSPYDFYNYLFDNQLKEFQETLRSNHLESALEAEPEDMDVLSEEIQATLEVDWVGRKKRSSKPRLKFEVDTDELKIWLQGPDDIELKSYKKIGVREEDPMPEELLETALVDLVERITKAI